MCACLESGRSLPRSQDTRRCAYFSAAAGRTTGRGLSSSMRGDRAARAEDHRMDVAAWLRALGLEQYAPAFRDNDIDGEVLPELTPDDLISIGVTSVGHRRRLLAAITALRDGPTRVSNSEMREQGPSPSVSTRIAADAERRQLTLMFCDLVGSTSLTARLDPEDLREVIGSYHRAVADIVAGFDGFVAKYM